MNCDLDGRTALVTGGGKGIGRAVSSALARMGARVVVNYRSDSAAAEDTAHEVSGTAVPGPDVPSVFCHTAVTWKRPLLRHIVLASVMHVVAPPAATTTVCDVDWLPAAFVVVSVTV